MQGCVLEPLGAVTTGSQFLEPDGKLMCPGYQSSGSTSCLFPDNYVHIQGKTPTMQDDVLMDSHILHSWFLNCLGAFLVIELGMFPNHIPNPEDKKAMEAITKAVLDQKADLGIIFDTDVDR